MKNKLLCTLLLTTTALVGQELPPLSPNSPVVNQQFPYVSAGLGPMPIPLPIFDLGYRIQRNHNGADLSLEVSTVVAMTAVRANLLYHYYFKPSLSSQFYVGGGIGPGVLFGSRSHEGFFISPEFVFGKQYRNESNDLRFFQAQISFPTIGIDNDHWGWYHHSKHRVNLVKFPLFTVSYGLGF